MGGTGRRRILIAGGTLLALLAAIGLASRAQTPTGGGGTRSLDGDLLLEYALLLTLALAVVVGPVAIWAFIAGRGERETPLPPRGNWMGAVVVTMVAFAIVSVLVLRGDLFGRNSSTRDPSAGPLESLVEKRTPARTVRFDWMPVIVVSSLTAAGLAAAAFALIRRRETTPGEATAELVVLALERTLDDLRAEPDPRRAVIAAYAQMERALGGAGLPRLPSEAPREYLRRVLGELGAGTASIERLTGLFERAKFSPHEIDSVMKEDAIGALEHLRDELRSAA